MRREEIILQTSLEKLLEEYEDYCRRNVNCTPGNGQKNITSQLEIPKNGQGQYAAKDCNYTGIPKNGHILCGDSKETQSVDIYYT